MVYNNFLFVSERAEELYQKFEEAIRDFSIAPLIEGGVLIGFSGGADSVMLAYLILEYRRRHKGFPVVLCHVNHGIRGDDADADEAFCRAFAKEHRLEITVIKRDVPRIARETSVGIERVARDVRYSAFEDIISGRNDLSAILTAHNATDNLETFIFVSMRGAGSHGLAGIPPVRNRVLRPMLYLSSEEIREFLSSANVPFVIDKSNLSTEYSRNYIRHEILPRLSRLSHSPEVSARRISRNLRDDDDFISGLAKKFLTESGSEVAYQSLLGMHIALFCRVLRRMASNCMLEEHHIRKVHMLLHSKRVFSYCLPMGYTFISDGSICRVTKEAEPLLPTDTKRPLVDGRILIPELSSELLIEYGNEPISSSKVYKFAIHKRLSSAIIEGDVYCRGKIDGDAYFYGGMTRRLKKLFCDRKLPHDVRMQLPILCDGKGILYVPGFGAREDTRSKDKNAPSAHFYTNDERLYRLLEPVPRTVGAFKEKKGID